MLVVGLGISFWASCLFANDSQFQVRLVLDAEEAKTIPHDSFSYTSPRGKNTELYVAKDIILSAQDVQDVYIKLQEDLLKDLPDGYWTIGSDGLKVLRYNEQDKLNLTAEPRIEFELTAEGAKKFTDFTKNHTQKSVAVIGDNQVLEKVMIMTPIQSGKIQILAHTDKINEMVKLVEGMGLKLKAKPAL